MTSPGWTGSKSVAQGVPPYPPEAGIEAKMLRAEDHLKTLSEFFREHFTENPCALNAQVYVQPQPGIHVYGQIPSPSIRGAAIVGDIVQNLRAALEYLACRLVEKECAGRMTPEEFQKVIDNTYFPTLTVPTDGPPTRPRARQAGPVANRPVRIRTGIRDH